MSREKAEGKRENYLLVSNAEHCLPTCLHEVRAGLEMAMLSFLHNGSEVVTLAQRIEPLVACERLVRVEASVHDVSEDLDRALEVPGVRELDGLVEQALGIAKTISSSTAARRDSRPGSITPSILARKGVFAYRSHSISDTRWASGCPAQASDKLRALPGAHVRSASAAARK